MPSMRIAFSGPMSRAKCTDEQPFDLDDASSDFVYEQRSAPHLELTLQVFQVRQREALLGSLLRLFRTVIDLVYLAYRVCAFIGFLTVINALHQQFPTETALVIEWAADLLGSPGLAQAFELFLH